MFRFTSAAAKLTESSTLCTRALIHIGSRAAQTPLHDPQNTLNKIVISYIGIRAVMDFSGVKTINIGTTAVNHFRHIGIIAVCFLALDDDLQG